MRKIRLFSLFILIITLALLVGCKKEDNVSSISLKDNDPSTAIEILPGDFDYDEYTVVAVYESGKIEETALTEDMIESADLFKFYQVGDHDITVNYADSRYTFKVSVKRYTFGELTFPENNVFTYNGEAHTVELDGEIPANAVVTYIGGNSFVNAGTYDVIAVISCDGYVTQKLSTTVKIERASYDMSGVKFESKEYTYDGKLHSLAISGVLPEGVSSPTYVLDKKLASGATDVGVYTVTAKFTGANPNYEPIPDMQATLTILPATYVVKDVSLVFRKASGEIIENFSKVYDGEQVVFDINDYGKLSSKVSVSFSVFDQEGNKISDSNKVTNIKNAGVYTVRADFTLANGKNYNPIEPVVCEFEIKKAAHPAIENVKLDSALSVYNGKEQSLKIDGTLPEGVTVSYVYYLGGKPVLGGDGKPLQSVVDAGRYTVEAVFSHSNKNLGDIPSLTAALNVEKISVDSFLIGFSLAPSAVYTGNAYEAKFVSWKETNRTDFDILEYSEPKFYVYDNEREMYVEMDEDDEMVEIGLYRIIITMAIKEQYLTNYVFSDGTTSITKVTDFEICKKNIHTPEVEFVGSTTYTYSGNSHSIQYASDADTDAVTLTTVYYRKDGDSYVPLGEGELPVNAGIYKFVVTAALKDSAHTVFTDGDDEKEYSFDFEIKKIKIDVSKYLINGAEYQYTGLDIRYNIQRSVIPAEILNMLNIDIIMTADYTYCGGSEAMYGIEERGSYGIYYYISVKDPTNVTVLSYGTEANSTYYWHTFHIV